jgi:hypothetical protein
VSLGALAHDAAVRAQRRRPTRHVRVDVSQTGEAPLVLADSDRIAQVLDNLLDNALRYAPAGSTVRARLAPAGTGIAVEVLDEGPGFPAAFLPHAFERFRRVDPARAEDGGGAGLGLAIVASLVQAHGGSVRAFNRPGGGACVRVELPASRGQRV